MSSASWVELTPWELSFLADVDPERPNALDRLGLAGAWLRDVDRRSVGERLFAGRVEQDPDIDPRAWVALAEAARDVASTVEATVVQLRGAGRELCLLTTERHQLVVLDTGLALRQCAGLDASEVARELLTVVDPVAVRGVRWNTAGEAEHVSWSTDDEPHVPAADVLPALARFAMGSDK